MPGLYVDALGPYAVAHLREDRFVGSVDGALDALGACGFEGVYLKRHPRRASGRGSRMPEELTPSQAVRGRSAPTPHAVSEGGAPFLLDLGDGLSVGLFLDQRANRARTRALARGRRVLNLFAYTCGFGLVAALGGARETVDVDLSRRALARGRRNYAAAGLDPSGGGHRFVREDAFRYLDRLARRGETFDLVVVDPPTFSTTRRGGRFTSGRDWVDLAAASLEVTGPGGWLLASSNDERLSPDELGGLLAEGAGRSGRRIEERQPAPTPDDFPPAPGAPRLRAFWLRVEGALPVRRLTGPSPGLPQGLSGTRGAAPTGRKNTPS
jgi:23S rRNA (cytosine1962-C5)-methyltransferase